MSELKDATVVPFNNKRTYAISCLLQHGDAPLAPGETRDNLMCCLHGMLESDPHLQYAGGFIKIFELKFPFDEKEEYWGGDAILITVSANYTAADVSRVINQNTWIVYDPILKKNYMNGEEHVLTRGPPPPEPSPK